VRHTACAAGTVHFPVSAPAIRTEVPTMECCRKVKLQMLNSLIKGRIGSRFLRQLVSRRLQFFHRQLNTSEEQQTATQPQRILTTIKMCQEGVSVLHQSARFSETQSVYLMSSVGQSMSNERLKGLSSVSTPSSAGGRFESDTVNTQ